MKNLTTNSTQKIQGTPEKLSDEAPMVVTRLSGWIDIGDGKTVTPSWIVPTRAQTQHQ